MKKSIWIIPAMLMLAACGKPDSGNVPGTTGAREISAAELSHRLLLVDTHIDVPYRLEEKYEDVGQATAEGDFDYPRALKGGLDAFFMSIYVPASYQETGGAFDYANHLIDLVNDIVESAPAKFALVSTTDDIYRNFEAGLISLPMGLENGAAIEGSLEKLARLHERGIRYITLTHSENNHISDSSYAKDTLWNGLSDFGRDAVLEMNRLGVMVDVSHVSDDAFYQVMEITKAPAIASHSSARAFTPGFQRNMSDDMISRLADSGGVIQVNFGSTFLTEEANQWSVEYNAVKEPLELVSGSDEEKAFSDEYRLEYPLPYASLADILDHIDHIVSLAGIQAVGLGSDFDGVGDSLPVGMKSVADYPNLVRGLIDRGYEENQIGLILGGNLMRVWKEVEDTALALQGMP